MNNQQIVNGTKQYLIGNYGRLPVAMVRGSGATLWDADGKEYIDLFAGFGAGGLGHCHRKVVQAIRDQAAELMCVGNLFTWPSQVELAERIVRHSFDSRAFFCHSGAEANEAALKLARLAAGEGRYKIISFHNCFHGRTMGALSLTPEKYQKGFEPMLAGNVKCDYGDLDGVAKAIDAETAGVIVEPIQGEGGVHVPEAAFLQGLRKLCDQHNLTLICDEVWTAPARTGQWFAYQHFGIEPDIMTLGKLAGGGVPVAACMAKPALADKLVPGTHGCTLGGNPVCAAAGAAVFKTIEEDNLLQAAIDKGQHIRQRLADAKLPAVKDIRGHGLMLGIELDPMPENLLTACMDKGLLINVTQGNVVRLAPPLTIVPDVLDKGLDTLIACLR